METIERQDTVADRHGDPLGVLRTQRRELITRALSVRPGDNNALHWWALGEQAAHAEIDRLSKAALTAVPAEREALHKELKVVNGAATAIKVLSSAGGGGGRTVVTLDPDGVESATWALTGCLCPVTALGVAPIAATDPSAPGCRVTVSFATPTVASLKELRITVRTPNGVTVGQSKVLAKTALPAPTQAGSSTSYSVVLGKADLPGLQANTTYAVTAVAVDVAGVSDGGTTVSFVPLLPGVTGTVFAAPVIGLATYTLASREVYVTWSPPPSTNATLQGFKVEVLDPLGGILQMAPANASARQLRTQLAPAAAVPEAVRLTATFAGTTHVETDTAVLSFVGGAPAPGEVGSTPSGAPAAPGAVALPAVPMTSSLAFLSPVGSSLAAPAVSQALALAGKWRADVLRQMAEEALAGLAPLEQAISELQQLDLAKVSVAELLAQPVLQQVLGAVSDLTGQVKTPDLTAALAELVDAAGSLTGLSFLVIWLARTEIVDFWRGLIEAACIDISNRDANAPAVREYIRKNMGGSLIAEIQAEIDATLGELKAEVRRTAALLTQQVLAGINEAHAAVAELLGALDGPLLQGAGAPGTVVRLGPQGKPMQDQGAGATNLPPRGAHVPNPDPLAASLAAVQQQVERVVNEVTGQLDALARGLRAGGPGGVVEAVMVTYVATPVLAALGVGWGAGPVGARLVATTVGVVLDEIVHLIAGWIVGPVSDQLDDLRARLDGARESVETTVATAFEAIGANVSGASSLAAQRMRLAGSAIRELSDLVPAAYLDSLAQLLGRRRDELLDHATRLALAAEHNLGVEHGALLDAIRPEYAGISGRPTAHQLPGGDDPARYLGSLLQQDLAGLDQQLVSLAGGRESGFTQRLSLLTLLGGRESPRWHQLMSGQAVTVRLDSSRLLEPQHPGAYRVMLNDLRIAATVAGPVPVDLAIPALVSHAGEHAMRVEHESAARLPASLLLSQLIDADTLLAGLQDAVTAARGLHVPAPDGVSWEPHVLMPWWYLAATTICRRLELRAGVLQLPFDHDPVLDAVRRWLGSNGFWADVDPDDPQRDQALLDVHTKQSFAMAVLGISMSWWKPPAPRPSFTVRRGTTTLTVEVHSSTTFAPTGLGLVLANNAPPSRSALQAAAATMAKQLQSVASGLLAGFDPWRKWGDAARLVQDADPLAADLGFVRLVRRGPGQTQAFTMQPAMTSATAAIAGGALSPLVGATAPASGGAVALSLLTTAPVDEVLRGAAASTYRPFECVGYDTDLTIQLPGLDGPQSLIAEQLTDVVLELDLRSCVSLDLVQAAQQRKADDAERVSALQHALPSLTGEFVPSALPSAQHGDVRLVRISLRSHRTHALRAFSEASQLAGNTGAALQSSHAAELSGLTPLTPWEPWRPLWTTTRTVTVAFRDPGAGAGVLSLDEMDGTVVLTRADFGIADSALLSDDWGQLLFLGYQTILSMEPPARLVRPGDPPGVRVRPPLTTLLPMPGAQGGAGRPQLRARDLLPLYGWHHGPDSGVAVPLRDVFTSGGGIDILLTDADVGCIYDVILTLRYQPPR